MKHAGLELRLILCEESAQVFESLFHDSPGRWHTPIPAPSDELETVGYNHERLPAFVIRLFKAGPQFAERRRTNLRVSQMPRSIFNACYRQLADIPHHRGLQ